MVRQELEPGTIIADVLTETGAVVTRYFFDAVDVATRFGFSCEFKLLKLLGKENHILSKIV